MRRRAFIESAGAAGALLTAGCGAGGHQMTAAEPYPRVTQLAGMTLPQLRQKYHDELFGSLLPFWDRHGIDHQYGGVMHRLDYDGALVSSEKLTWFQGRTMWVYSFLYNNFERNPAYLEVARQTKDFLLKHAPQPDGWWAEAFARDGTVIQPFAGDLYGMYFAAEGLQEFAWAAKDDQARDLAFGLMKKLFRRIHEPDFHCMDTAGPGHWTQGLWMVNLNTARQMLVRWPDPEIQSLLDHAIDAVINHHYNPDIGLDNEDLHTDFTRPPEEAHRSIPGHSIETLWMIMEESRRRNDWKLWDTCAARIHKHLDVGWDHVFGGVCECVNVDQGGYVWPVNTPVGTDLKFSFVGEYFYMKTLWSLNETLVATLNVLEQTGADWALRYFDLAQRLIDEKFSMKKYGQPGYLLFGDRRMTRTPHATRQDNYHPLRQLMLSLLALDRMIPRQGRPARA